VSRVPTAPALREAYRRHERRWAENRYVYAVVSRRSGGLSVGINLNPDKGCNFDCLYCQVDRTVPPAVRRVDLGRLADELDRLLAAERDGSLYAAPPFDAIEPGRRGVRDLAFSGDGEPTAFPRFKEAVEIVVAARARWRLTAKIVVITDAAYLRRPRVRDALERLDQHGGEVWAKLDAGTEAYFRLVDRPNVSLETIVGNILDTARERPVVVQSLFCRVDGAPPPPAEIDAYIGRLRTIVAAGGQLRTIQLYTIARRPASPRVAPLADAELDAIAAEVRAQVTVPVELYYGVPLEDAPLLETPAARPGRGSRA
jgi:wyosine [tRNA(Phe)-imidazoG37] synthetase (radical SAM superfamily)